MNVKLTNENEIHVPKGAALTDTKCTQDVGEGVVG